MSGIIKIVREFFGHSQQEFSNFLRTPLGTYRDWETGRSKVPGVALEFINFLFKEKNNMKVIVIHIKNINGQDVRRVISGEMVDMMELDWTQSLTDLKEDAEYAFEALLPHPKFAEIGKKYRENLEIYQGANHLNIIIRGKSKELNWFTVTDNFVYRK